MDSPSTQRPPRKYLLVESPHLKMFEGVREYMSVSDLYYEGLMDELRRHENFLADFMAIKEKLNGVGMGYDQFFALMDKVWMQYVHLVRTGESDAWLTARINGLRLKHRWFIACGYLYLEVFDTYQTTKMTKSRLILGKRLDQLIDLMETVTDQDVRSTEEELQAFSPHQYKEELERKILRIN